MNSKEVNNNVQSNDEFFEPYIDDFRRIAFELDTDKFHVMDHVISDLHKPTRQWMIISNLKVVEEVSRGSIRTFIGSDDLTKPGVSRTVSLTSYYVIDKRTGLESDTKILKNSYKDEHTTEHLSKFLIYNKHTVDKVAGMLAYSVCLSKHGNIKKLKYIVHERLQNRDYKSLLEAMDANDFEYEDTFHKDDTFTYVFSGKTRLAKHEFGLPLEILQFAEELIKFKLL